MERIKQIKKEKETAKGMRKAFLSIEMIIVLVFLALFLAFVLLFLYPKLKINNEVDKIKSNYQLVMSGLNDYKSDAGQYPASGWDWNNGGTYISDQITGRWQYECQNGDTIKITTQPINNPKVRTRVATALLNQVKRVNPNASVQINGNVIEVTIPDSECEQ